MKSHRQLSASANEVFAQSQGLRTQNCFISLLSDCLVIFTSVFTDIKPKINLTYSNLTHKYPELFKKNMNHPIFFPISSPSSEL